MFLELGPSNTSLVSGGRGKTELQVEGGGGLTQERQQPVGGKGDPVALGKLMLY